MAGDWIKFETTTPDKPEIFAIAEQLQLDPDAVVGKILRVWIWADSQTENGRLPVRKLSASQTDICHATVLHRIVDRLVSVPGFASAMEAVGWLDHDGSLPRFDRHNGKSAKKRALDLQRKRAERTPSVHDLSAPKADKNRTRDREERRDIKKEDPPDLLKKAASKDQNHRQKKTKRAPDDFLITEAMQAWAAEECQGIDLAYHTQKFLDHTFGTARQDWTATWRNWMRTERERKHEADQRGLGRTGRETVDDKLRRLRGAGKPSVGEPDGDVRGQVLEGVRFRA
jgi:hypothetical protein